MIGNLRTVLSVLMTALVLIGISPPVQAQEGFFVEAFVDNANPYVGEPVLYTFRLYNRQEFAEFPEYAPPDFSGFWQGETFDLRNFAEIVGDKPYNVTEVRTVIYPNYAGDVTIAPAQLIFPVNVFQSQQVYLTEAVDLTVKALPAGAPDVFTGGVGLFDFTLTLEQQTLALGEPALLSLVVRGWGNLQQMPLPILTLPEDWRVYTNRSRYSSTQQDGAVVGERHFEWLFVPSEAGSHDLPAIAFAYFNPVNSTYQTVATDSLRVDVLPSDNQALGLAIVAEDLPPLALKPLQGALRVGSVGGFSWLRMVFWLVPPIGFVGGLLWQRRRKYQAENRLVTRQANALKQALADLKKAEKLDGNAMYRTVSTVIYRFVADKALLDDVSGWNQQTILDIFTERGLKTGLKQQVIACLEQADSGLYAPADVTDQASLLKQAEKVLVALDAAWGQA